MKRAASALPLLGLLLIAGLHIGSRGSFPSSSVPPSSGTDPSEELQRILDPEALKSVWPPASLEELRKHFADPPAEFRTGPLWVWNDEMSEERIREQLRQFRQQGMGQVFVHPRPGLITEYLGDEWFDMWKVALNEAKQLGLLCNIYDENSYPAGFAGGHVPSLAPDTAVQYVQAHVEESARGLSQGPSTVAAFRIERDASGRTTSAVRIPEREYPEFKGPVLIFSLRRASGNPWTGQFPYVDLTHPDTARLFIQTTYEPYKQHFGDEFGKTIKWSFDDEPLLATAGAYEQGQQALPLSYHTLAAFEVRNGYDLRDTLPSLFWDVGDWGRVRFDYWQTMHDLWKENYMRPLFLWCDRNDLRFTGHFMEHEWPYPWISPDDASLYAYMHTPGIDMLVGGQLRATGADPHMLFTIRQVASVAHQLGRRAFSETYGVAGWDSTLEHYKRMGDWQIVHGINFLNQHLAFTTVRGARKRDHPQSFSDVAAWWPYYRLHADHTARLCYVMSQGTVNHRVLVLEPTTSGFLWARRGGETPELQRLRETFGELNQFLADHQVDFDLGDEYVLEWFGEARGKQIRVGRATYDLLVLPRGLVNLRRQTLPILERYLQAGGEILALDTPPAYVDGQGSNAARNLREQFASQWHEVSDTTDLLVNIQRRLSPRVSINGEPATGLGHRMTVLESGDRFHLFTNSSPDTVSVKVTMEGGTLEEWDSVTGKIGPASFRSTAPGKIEFVLDLPPAASRLLLVPASPQGKSATSRQTGRQVTTLSPSGWRVTPTSPNVLALDYCDLRLAGKIHRDINTWQANWLVWQAHGFERPAWDSAIQFRRRILDREPFPDDSGFEAAFHFHVADAAALDGMQLALECPELYKVFVNGESVGSTRGERWLDPHLMSFPVENLVKVGENTVRIVGSPFQVRMELENIYLRGSFAVIPAERGFSIHAAPPLDFGSWAKQGYPFYSDCVVYEASVEVPRGARLLRVSFPRWAGSVAEVLLDGKPVRAVGWKPFECEVEASPGHHIVGVRVVATPRNLFGPFHNPSKPRMVAWPWMWGSFPQHQPPGSEYDVFGYGLMEPFLVQAVK